MHWLGWVLVALALLEGGWLAFDGAHAIFSGDYVSPKSGPHAGQLGPWSKVVVAIGIAPRSTPMKLIHFVLGLAWLVVIICFILKLSWAWTAMLICAILGIWYLPFGTALSIAQIVLLFLPQVRST